MQAKVSITEAEILQAIKAYIESQTGISVPANEIRIEVKSAQNYKSEWEKAHIRCEFEAKVRND
jgi:hypothetical protein